MQRMLSLAALAAGCAALAVVLLGRESREAGDVVRPAAAEEVDVLRHDLMLLSRRVNGLQAQIEMLQESLPPAAPAPPPGREPSDERAGPADDDSETPSDASPLPATLADLRKVIREEVKRSRRSPWSSSGTEQWERDEFGGLATYVHHMGERLGLSEAQKREYFRLYRDFRSRVSGLYARVRGQMGEGAARGEVYKRYSQAYGEERERFRDDVMRMLTPEQQEKYRRMGRGYGR